MDALNEPGTHTVVIMASAQVSKSETLLNVVGYHIDQDPAPILFLQPTLEMAEAFSKDRIAPMIRDTPALAARVSDVKSREGGNTLLHKLFEGGHLTLAGANSAASLASRPIRIVLADEVDRYPISAGTEGDPLTLAMKRTATFWNRRAVVTSTPTIKGASRIEAAYNESDKRRYYVPCPHCAEMQVLKWANVRWPPGQPENAAYTCPHCGGLWAEGQRTEAVQKGEWRAEVAKFTGTAGFHINELYSPWATLAGIAAAFLAAKDHPERLKTWVNTSLGETWESAADTVDMGVLQARAEDYELGTIPEGALIVTAGVDVQGDRLELSIYGWGEGEECWMLDRDVLYGDPAREVVWQQLLERLAVPLTHANGALVVPRVVAIDSGFKTQETYTFCRAHAMRRTDHGLQQIIATKGQKEFGKPAVGRPTAQDVSHKGDTIKKGVKLWPVGSSSVKQRFYGRLRIEAPGPGYVHFSNQLPEDYYDQLTSERLVTKYIRGFGVLEWHLPSGRRNEALDCLVYAYAGACMLGLSRIRPAQWGQLRKQHDKTALPVPGGVAPADPSPPAATLQPPAPAPYPTGRDPFKGWQPPAKNFTTQW